MVPGEGKMAKGQLQAHQRKGVLAAVFKSNWKSPEIRGLLDTIRFTNSLRLDHADGTRTELEANVNVNSILQASSASMDVELKATHTGKGFEVGGTARVVVSEAGAQKADLALFAATKRQLSGGRTLRSGIFLDVAAMPGDAAGSDSNQFSLRTRSELETASGTRLRVDADLERRLDGSSRAGARAATFCSSTRTPGIGSGRPPGSSASPRGRRAWRGRPRSTSSACPRAVSAPIQYAA